MRASSPKHEKRIKPRWRKREPCWRGEGSEQQRVGRQVCGDKECPSSASGYRKCWHRSDAVFRQLRVQAIGGRASAAKRRAVMYRPYLSEAVWGKHCHLNGGRMGEGPVGRARGLSPGRVHSRDGLLRRGASGRESWRRRSGGRGKRRPRSMLSPSQLPADALVASVGGIPCVWRSLSGAEAGGGLRRPSKSQRRVGCAARARARRKCQCTPLICCAWRAAAGRTVAARGGRGSGRLRGGATTQKAKKEGSTTRKRCPGRPQKRCSKQCRHEHDLCRLFSGAYRNE